jgi:adenine-specific DNA glycosylase
MERRVIALVIRRGDRVLIRQRPAGVVNAHLWEFPNAEVALDEKQPSAAAARQLGVKIIHSENLGRIRHSITRYRITMGCVAASIRGRPPSAIGQWISIEGTKSLAFTAAHRKLLQRLVSRRNR